MSITPVVITNLYRILLTDFFTDTTWQRWLVACIYHIYSFVVIFNNITSNQHLFLDVILTPVQFRFALQWRRNGRDGVSTHQNHHCFHNRLFGRRSKKTSKLRVTGLCPGNSPGTREFPAQMASNAENVSIWWTSSWIQIKIQFTQHLQEAPDYACSLMHLCGIWNAKYDLKAFARVGY